MRKRPFLFFFERERERDREWFLLRGGGFGGGVWVGVVGRGINLPEIGGRVFVCGD